MSAQQETGTTTTHRVLIPGAGYAGLAAAVQLAARVGRREDVRVTVPGAEDHAYTLSSAQD
ncbi:hypothetical protein ACFVUT_10525 [Streptomyces sp. NPDC058051]